MKRLIGFLAIAALAAIASCKDRIGPDTRPQLSVANLQPGPDSTSIYVVNRDRMNLMWHIRYGKTLNYGSRFPLRDDFGPSVDFIARFPTDPGTTYYFEVTAWNAILGVTYILTSEFETPNVTITISPKSVTMDVGSSTSFTASLTGTAHTALKWTTTIGTIDGSGRLTSPTTPDTGTVTVCSEAYPTICDSATAMAVRLDLILFMRIDSAPSTRCSGAQCEEIYTMTSDGANVRMVTTTTWFQDIHPAWFPDGRKFAFVRSRASSTQTICIANADGSEPRCLNLTGMNMLYPSVSPNGQRIVFQYRDEEPDFTITSGGIAIMDTSGANLRRILRIDVVGGSIGCLPSNPNWSPDGQQIAFARCDGQVWAMDTLGGNLTNLTRNDLRNGEPVWSPDGQRIAYAASPAPGSVPPQIYTMNADGSNQTQITHDAVGAVDPTWSPNGQRIAYAGGCCWQSSMDIYIANADGSGSSVNITNTPTAERWPAWRP
ncbi:MAG: WD40-like protein Beta Propeller [Candidatus Jorgensenbacteria bacterium GW2011_GWA1_48_11]|uniref:WD40-like protein Beta Propeller n=1 Tax=Candidatus Jorgensenbacteria bacterium GW2011_GWA1_48_11 TaxID=1618660 RepID=A0A0G1UC78_9BACT|nr:MAG: WD40-like protein Beta Propeller [Candidatus Jorgensenbacteria bacterium GW2011_GWA1_48_11]KKW12218.1 MAG: WD40-like protein Beta Propeller [Candidatus Jorgensenbacteria bacterium GW2011_GWB1_49_9]